MTGLGRASTVAPMRKPLSTLIALIVGFVGLGLSPALAVDERVIDVVAVTWPGAPVLPGDASEIARLINTEVSADWKKFTTLYGDTKDRTISFTTGKVLAEPIALISKMACVGVAATAFMNSIRTEAYERLGISDYSKRYLVVVAPRAGCVWSGRAQVGGVDSASGIMVLHDSAESYVITHELGHTFGLGHTNFLRCENNKNDGPWGDTCKAVEYGGTIDVMGNVSTSSPLSTYHQWRMGLLEDSQIKQIWQSEVVTLAPSDFANGVRALYVRDGKAAYWIEYRRKLDGVGYKPGLAIYRLDPPPITSIVSPNPEDTSANEFGALLGADLWMLNLDTYQYRSSTFSGGSMTGVSAATYSGNVSLSAVPSETGAVVTIKKKPDTAAPPVPVIVPVNQWRSPSMVILEPGFEDADTAITSFEAQIDGVVKALPVSDVNGWLPTYLSPFVAPKTVYLKDLPEGSYSFAIRSVDLVGNKSEWSKPEKVVIDRGRPTVTNDFAIQSINGDQLSLAWVGAKDAGSGLCQTNLVNEEGFIVQSSTAKTSPTFKLKRGSALDATAQIFDCLGNGITGQLSLTNSFIAAEKSSRTGKWSPADAGYGAGAIKCVGKCTASFSTAGRFDVLVGTGAAVVSAGSKVLATIPDSKVAKLRIGASVDAGIGKKPVRMSGSNFVLIGLASITSTLSPTKDLDRLPAISDPSLSEPKQIALAKYGFIASDFSQEWKVLPMARGTTLDDPSLDLCNGTYTSEKDRVERRQVTATKVGSVFTFLSTEVVRYSSATAAQSAQKELAKTLAKCIIDKGYTETTGTYVAYTFTDIKNQPTGLVVEGSRVLVRAQIGSGQDARQLLAFYQFNGEIFTGLYIMTPGEKGFTDLQVSSWHKVAVTMATRLSGKPA
ncbi:unannotated protein [freshwater metagenome]|uniref:Unannotated protein n=1 Tax=freshwater metagenome TaxID=449393 RepID=A0A6J6ZXI5_9ZZZZ